MQSLVLKEEPLPNPFIIDAAVVEKVFDKINKYKSSPDYKYILAFELMEDDNGKTRLFFPAMNQSFKWVDGKPYEFGDKLFSFLSNTFGIDSLIGWKNFYSAKKLLGCSEKHVQNLYKRTKKLWTKKFIVPIYELYPLIASGKHVHQKKIERIGIDVLNTKLGIYRECKADKQDNISYLCAALSLTPQEARKTLGKGVWKSLCKNSKTKNLMIGRQCMMDKFHANNIAYINTLPYSVIRHGYATELSHTQNREITNILIPRWKEIIQYKKRMFKETKKEWFDTYGMEYPHRPLPYVGGKARYATTVTAKHPRAFIRSADVFINLVIIVRDAIRCARELYSTEHILNRFKNSKFEDFQDIHDEYMEESNRRREEIQRLQREREEVLFTSNFPFVHNLPHVVEYNGFKATLMLNASELSEEGKHMSHCVAGYWKACHDKNSIIYKIEGPTKADRSTCEFQLNNVLRQNRHYYNQAVSESNKEFVVILQNSISHFMAEDARIGKLNEELPNEYHRQIEQQSSEPNISSDIVPCIIKRYIKESGGEQT